MTNILTTPEWYAQRMQGAQPKRPARKAKNARIREAASLVDYLLTCKVCAADFLLLPDPALDCAQRMLSEVADVIEAEISARRSGKRPSRGGSNVTPFRPRA
jgi:hypothetical protein